MGQTETCAMFFSFVCVCVSSRYSFRVPPRLDLRVRPMLGER